MPVEEGDVFTPAMHRVQRLESLHPMSSGEVLDLTTKAYREIGMRVLGPTFSAATLVYIAFMMMTQLVLPQLFTTKNPTNVYGQVAEVVTTVALGLLTALPIVIIGLSVIVTHSVHATSDFIANRSVHAGERQVRADQDLYRSMKLMGRTLLLACSGLLGTLALLLVSALLNDRFENLSAAAGGIAVLAALVSLAAFLYVMVRHSLAPASALLEGLSTKQAAKRSVQLIRAYRGAGSGDDTILRLGFTLVLLALCSWGGIAGIYSLLGVMPWLQSVLGRHWWGEVAIALVSGLPYLLAFWVMAPVFSVGSTLVYFERRIRLEGYDISLLHQELALKR